MTQINKKSRAPPAELQTATSLSDQPKQVHEPAISLSVTPLPTELTAVLETTKLYTNTLYKVKNSTNYDLLIFQEHFNGFSQLHRNGKLEKHRARSKAPSLSD